MVFIKLVSVISITLLVAACSVRPASYNVLLGGKNTEKLRSIGKIALIPATLSINEKFPNGLVTEIPQWSQQAKDSVSSQIIQTMSRRYMRAEVINLSDVANLAQYLPLIRRMLITIHIHSRGENLLPHKMDHFDYTLGGGLKDLKHMGYDALLVFGGGQQLRAQGVQDLKYDIFQGSNFSIVFGVFQLAAMLIDTETGDVLWYQFLRQKEIDTRKTETVAKVVDGLLVSFPSELLREKL